MFRITLARISEHGRKVKDLLLTTYSEIFYPEIVAGGIDDDSQFRFRTESLGGKQ